MNSIRNYTLHAFFLFLSFTMASCAVIDWIDPIYEETAGINRPYEIIFDANGGTGIMNNLTAAEGALVNLTTNTYTMAGYAFLGWSTSSGAACAEYTDAASYAMGSSNVTLYAVWQSAPSWSGTQQLGSTTSDEGLEITIDCAGSLYVAGKTNGNYGGTNQGSSDIFINKFNSAGNSTWTKQLGSSSYDQFEDMKTDFAGNIYLTGYTGGDIAGPSQGSADFIIFKYDINGNNLWQYQLGSSSNDYGKAITVDAAGNIYLTGITMGDLAGTNQGHYDTFIAKYDANGNNLWLKQFGTTTLDAPESIMVDSAGNVYVAGNTQGSLFGPNLGSTDIFIAKYDTNGNSLWGKQFGTASNEEVNDIVNDSVGNLIITGYTFGDLGGVGAGNADIFIAKYNAAGNNLWNKQLGTGDYDGGTSITSDGLNNIYVTGQTMGNLAGTNQGGFDIFIVKYDSPGNALWQTQLGTSSRDDGEGITVDSAGNIYVTGHTGAGLDLQQHIGSDDVFIVKYDENGNKL